MFNCVRDVALLPPHCSEGGSTEGGDARLLVGRRKTPVQVDFDQLEKRIRIRFKYYT